MMLLVLAENDLIHMYMVITLFMTCVYGQVQIRIQIVGARIYQAVIPKVLIIPD